MATILLLLSLTVNAISLQSSYAIIGTVVSEDGRAVDSIRVSVLDDNYRNIKTVFTEHSGRYIFRGIPPGAYTVKVTPVGSPYEESSLRIDLPPGFNDRRGGGAEETVTVDLVLRRKRTSSSGEPGVVFAQDIPEAARREYKRGADSLKNNNAEVGLAALENALQVFPDYFLALELLGTEYVKREEFEKALVVLTHAVEINRTAPRSLYALGVAYLKLHRAPEASESLRKAVQQDPENTNAHLMLGVAYGYTGALKQAEESLRRAYQLGGSQAADAHLYLAGIYNKQEKFREGVRELELYLKEKKDADTDTVKVKAMIDKLKAKEKAKKG